MWVFPNVINTMTKSNFGSKGFIWLTFSHKSITEKSHSIVLRKGKEPDSRNQNIDLR